MKKQSRFGRQGASTPKRLWAAAVVAALMAMVAPSSALAAKPGAPAGAGTFGVSDASASEGASGTTDMTFTVSLSAPVNAATSVKYATANGTAIAPSDYNATSGVINFAANETSKTFRVQIQGDALFETNESFTVNLSRPRGAKIGDKTGTGTIVNDDAAPAFSIGDVSVTEGNSGTVSANFNVTVTSSGAAASTVAYSTAAGTADGSDFTAGNGTLTFAVGDLSEMISVPVKGDIFDEEDETFVVTLSNPQGAVITDGEATGTILDDDEAPRLSISDTVAAEPADGGSNSALFAVTLSAPSQKTISFDYATAAGTATEGDDYTAGSSTLNIPAGQTQAQVSIPLAHDDVSEVPNETFVVNLSNPVNAQLHDSSGQGTILDFDALPVVSANVVSVQEGDEGATAATVTVGLSIESSEAISVDYATNPGTAGEVSDYAPSGGTLSFAAGERTKTVQIDVQGDAVDELDEQFAVALSNATGGSASAGAAGSVTVLDDDATPAVSVSDITVSEVGSGSAKVVFTLTTSGASDRDISASYTLENGTALSGFDYAGQTGTVTIPAGATSANLEVTVYGDSKDEANEDFFVQLSDFENATGGKDRGKGTIVDTDKSRSATSIKVRKKSAAMVVKGMQRKPRPGQKMVVKLMKKKGTKWALVSTKRPVLSAATDVNGDGVKESTFKVRFKKPATAKLFKIVAKYAGDANNTASKATRKVRYR